MGVWPRLVRTVPAVRISLTATAVHHVHYASPVLTVNDVRIYTIRAFTDSTAEE